MPAINFAFDGWDALMNASLTLAEMVKDETAAAVDIVSRQTQDEVQFEMPVDTGWAQARWGVPEYGGIWERRDNGLTIEQGSSIEPFEYIERLNEGSSQQAPAGFIDTAAERAGDRLETAIDDVTTKIDNS